ncbi:hypothetical protein GCM10023237_13320 [Streptomyces coeruleoprunus]
MPASVSNIASYSGFWSPTRAPSLLVPRQGKPRRPDRRHEARMKKPLKSPDSVWQAVEVAFENGRHIRN